MSAAQPSCWRGRICSEIQLRGRDKQLSLVPGLCPAGASPQAPPHLPPAPVRVGWDLHLAWHRLQTTRAQGQEHRGAPDTQMEMPKAEVQAVFWGSGLVPTSSL